MVKVNVYASEGKRESIFLTLTAEKKKKVEREIKRERCGERGRAKKSNFSSNESWKQPNPLGKKKEAFFILLCGRNAAVGKSASLKKRGREKEREREKRKLWGFFFAPFPSFSLSLSNSYRCKKRFQWGHLSHFT